MKMTSFAVASLLLVTMVLMAPAADKKTKAKAESKKPAAKAEAKKPAVKTEAKKPTAKPGWVVLEEFWWYPLRFESVTALDNARYHYRRNEEKAAANDVRKAVSWLKYAAGHAMPITKEKLDTAVTELTTLAKNLEDGKVTAAAQMDKALARASHALAEWHFYKAKESYGKDEAGYAANDLEAAVAHLQHAANSAHYQYGADTITMFDHIRKNGKMVSEKKTIDNNLLGKHLDGIEKAVKEMGDTLKKTSATVAVKTPSKPVSTKPATPGWVVVEEDWWFPFRYDFLDSMHQARIHYRAREEKAASAEIDKAITWLKYAENHADKVSAEALTTARADLMDFSTALKSGKRIEAKRLDNAFANAAAALAKHHHFKSSAALAKGDLKTAGQHLMAAADHVRAAARSANQEYGREFVTIYDDFAPFGYWDESIEFTPSNLGSNLTTIQNELAKLSAKLKSSK